MNLHHLRARLQIEAALAQELHDSAVGRANGDAITDTQRVNYLCVGFSIDRERIDKLIRESRELRSRVEAGAAA